MLTGEFVDLSNAPREWIEASAVVYEVDSVFHHPFPSARIGVVLGQLSQTHLRIQRHHLSRVCWAMPLEEGVVIVPLNHYIE